MNVQGTSLFAAPKPIAAPAESTGILAFSGPAVSTSGPSIFSGSGGGGSTEAPGALA